MMDHFTKITLNIPPPASVILYHKLFSLAQGFAVDEQIADTFAQAVANHCSDDLDVDVCCTIYHQVDACSLLVEGEQWQESLVFSDMPDAEMVLQQKEQLLDMSQKNLLKMLHDKQMGLLQQCSDWKQKLGQMSLEMQQQQQSMEHQFMHDALTGLPNKHFLQERSEQLFKLTKRQKLACSLLIMDINEFKDVNDTLGYHTGDSVLCIVAKRLRHALRASDMLIRLGGDEFAVLVFNNNAEEAEKVALKLQQALGRPLECEGTILSLEASIGIAEFPVHGDNLDLLMSRADVAMYYAKKHGTKTAVYDVLQDKNSTERMTLLKELTEAIKSDGMELYYQPQVQMNGSHDLSVEALIRWNNPERGMVFPDQFIPLAEDSGLIIPMTWWVLETAMKQCVLWHQEGLPVNVSINISANFLQEDDVVKRVATLMHTYQVPNDVFALEITENTLMDDPHQAAKILSELNKLNIEVSIDDFGTGYSSLAYLKHLELDELKIDRSFVMGMSEYKNDKVIVQTVINMAHSMGLRVVAEGVENRKEWDFLANMGCDFIQGYFISRPKPVGEVSEWLRDFYKHGVQLKEGDN